jgi:hypothetical protein
VSESKGSNTIISYIPHILFIIAQVYCGIFVIFLMGPPLYAIHTSHKAYVAKSEFKNNELVKRLLRENVIKNAPDNSNYAYFDNSINNENQLRKRLKPIGIGDEIESISAIWRESSKNKIRDSSINSDLR